MIIIEIIIFIIGIIYIKNIFNKNNKRDFNWTYIGKEINTEPNIPIEKIYTTNFYLMTQTELKFYRELKKITDKNNWIIFPQVNLERILQVKDNNFADRNRIKSRSIDYTIVNNDNCKIICCIELDDYTHNTNKAKQIDNFKNEIFKQVNIPLHRIKVDNYYDLEQIESILKGNF